MRLDLSYVTFYSTLYISLWVAVTPEPSSNMNPTFLYGYKKLHSLWGGCLYICHTVLSHAYRSQEQLVQSQFPYQWQPLIPDELYISILVPQFYDKHWVQSLFWYDLGWDTYYIIIICSFKNYLELLVLEPELTLIDFSRAEQILFVFHFITTSWPLNECHRF